MRVLFLYQDIITLFLLSGFKMTLNDFFFKTSENYTYSSIAIIHPCPTRCLDYVYPEEDS